MFDLDTLRYACGHPCCPDLVGQCLSDVRLTEVAQFILLRQESWLCPGCMLEECAKVARSQSEHLGLKRLIGEPRTAPFAEMVRFHVVVAALTDERWSKDSLLLVLNRPAARQGRLWMNYRDAAWSATRRQELISALCAG